jgi:hypothetical protein
MPDRPDLQMDPTLKIGDTANCDINGESTEVAWLDEWTLLWTAATT